MSSNSAARAESAGLLVAAETIGSLGTPPTTGWYPLQPDQNQINDFYKNVVAVAASPISPERQMQKPVITDANCEPKFTQDLTADLIAFLGEGMFLSKAFHNGGTGQSRFLPTARTTSAYTVGALGALPQNTLVFANGWKIAANNGLFAVGAGSTGTSITVSGGVAETPSGYLATLEVAGVRGASGDIGLDVNGNLTSTALDFTTLGLAVGQEIYVGGVPGSGFAFATAGYSGVAEVAAIATNLLTLKQRAWTVGGADPGTGKTIDLYFTRLYRNVSTLHANYQEQPYHLEVSLPLSPIEYIYAQGMYVKGFKITAALGQLVKCEVDFIGTNVTDPTSSRFTGPSSAPVPLATDRFTTANGARYVQVLRTDTEASVASDIEDWTITVDNGVTAQKQQGTLGPKRLIVGKIAVSLDTKIVVTQDDAIKACTANTTLAFGMLVSNTNGGAFWKLPAMTFTGAVPTFPANGVVEISPKGGAFIDPTLRDCVRLSYFAYLPAS